MVDSSAADSSLQRTDKKADGVGKTFAKGIGTAAKWGVGVVIAGAAAVGSLIAVASKSAATAAAIDDMAQRTNLSSKTLQEFGYAAEQSGTSMEVIEKGAIKLTKTMAAYKNGNKATVQAFKDLGLSAEDSNGKLKSTDEMYPQIIEKLAGMKDITERNALSMELFGKSGAELGPLLNEGAAGIKGMRDEAGKLGLVLSEETIAAGAKFDDEMAKVQASLGAVVTKIGLGLMPIVSAMLNWVTTNMPTIQAVATKAFDFIKLGVKVLGDVMTNILIPAFKKVYDFVQVNMPTIKDVMATVFDGIKIAVDTAVEVFNVLVDALKSITTWIGENQTLVETIAIIVGSFAIAWGAVNLALGIWAVVGAIATGVTTAFGVAVAFLTSPIFLVALAIGALIAIGILLYKNWDTIKTFMLALWETLKTKASEIFTAIWTTIKNAFSATIGWFKNIFTSAWNGIKAVFAAVGSFFSGVWNGIKNVFSATVSWFRGIFQGAWTAIKAVFSGVGSFFGGLWNTIKSKFSSIGSAIGNAIGGAFKSVVNSIISFAQNTINGFIRSINGAIGLINKIPGVEISTIARLAIPRLEKGGIVDSGQIYQAGENGKEVIMPLEKNLGWIDNLASKLNGRGGNNGDGGLHVTINGFVNNRKQDIQAIMDEMEFYRKQAAVGR